MKVINLTGIHDVNVFPQEAFTCLEQVNETLWVADGVDQALELAVYPTAGMSARISTDVEAVKNSCLPGEVVKTTYGELTGIPEGIGPDDTLIVSLPTKTMAHSSGHPMAKQMVSPYKVVRLRSNTSQVLGCMGFSW